MQPVGRLQRPTCVVPYADAGKTCSDKADCQGACIAEGNLEAQGATTGQCQKTNVQFGCYAKIVGGKSTARDLRRLGFFKIRSSRRMPGPRWNSA
jgi:hypothetical protein